MPADLVNLIEYNPIEAAKYSKPDEDVVDEFMAYLEKHRVNARLRRSRGKDIDAACGQLAGDVLDRTNAARRLAQRRVDSVHPIRVVPLARHSRNEEDPA